MLSTFLSQRSLLPPAQEDTQLENKCDTRKFKKYQSPNSRSITAAIFSILDLIL
jgi:hypothetical protein